MDKNSVCLQKNVCKSMYVCGYICTLCTYAGVCVCVYLIIEQ